jgi:hypothetical protein
MAKRPQPVLALGASLCAIGALMGRKYRTESNIRSNRYVVGIAESGAGKNHSRVVINELFRKANLLQSPGRQQDRIRLWPVDGHPAPARDPVSARRVRDVSLGSSRPQTLAALRVCEILDLMTELYTTSGTTLLWHASTQATNSTTRTGPFTSPAPASTAPPHPLHFWQALQASNVADGSLARFLIMESEDDFPDSNEAFGVIDPPQDLIDRLILIRQGRGQAQRQSHGCGCHR